MLRLDVRYSLLLIILMTLVVMGASFYFEYVDGLNPCPLCLMQRLCTMGILVTALWGLFSHRRAVTARPSSRGACDEESPALDPSLIVGDPSQTRDDVNPVCEQLRRAKGLQFFLISQSVLAAFGMFFSARQVWLQWMPPAHSTVCLPGFKMMVHYLPWKEVVRTLFLGAGDCAEVSWHWLGLTMPAWALLYFIFILIFTILVSFQENE